MTEALPHDSLMAHARAAARADECRHPASAAHVERTLRAWGNAALQDLEWTSQRIYAPTLHAAYRDAYAEEYRRVRDARRAEAAG